MDIAYSRYGLQLSVQAKGNRKSWEEIKGNGAATSLKKRKELIIFVKEKREKLNMAKKSQNTIDPSLNRVKKRTSIGSSVRSTPKNKRKRAAFKKYRGQGKC